MTSRSNRAPSRAPLDGTDGGANVVWPFDQAPNVAAMTAAGVLERRLPILLVHHDEDESWSFLCGTTQAARDCRGIGTVLRLDPSLREVADLPPGWIAWRIAADRAWTRSPYGEET
jgi:hypothetical protein